MLSSWLPSLVFMYSFIMATVNQIKTENQIFNATTGNKTVFIMATALIFFFGILLKFCSNFLIEGVIGIELR